ncbi:UDP-glucose dehydrogenase family protein [Microbacterium halophytorum]|uniref:UDP-glucose dehydrogenase family protein n=1 Tax=Microbacterium halophytorum TaxID=2067568 RepID=UPI000CFD4E1A|nr:UDP-glucose/GDP-mannose dehydrogenase family protein [Microbacterium halophytorum]
MRISVIGCGYLGAVHAAAMASLGHDVVGIDVDEDRVRALAEGVSPIFEPGLPEALREGIAAGRLRFSSEMSDAAAADVHFVAVGTPQLAHGAGADVSYVDAAFAALREHLRPGALVVGKSTVPVGTAARLAEGLAGAGARLIWNPEFLREGRAIRDTVAPDRLVYGVSPAGDDGVATLDEVYAPLVARGTPRLVTDYATAELVKTAANAFLATKISFINAMADVAEATGADVTTLADAIGHDARIGRKFLNAGVGFGGGCLPKDIRAFVARAEELGLGDSLAFLKEVDRINLRRRERLVDLVVDSFEGEPAGRRVAVLGLAFKPESDDIRDSPALDVAVRLRGLGAKVRCYDPEAMPNARRMHPQLKYAATAEHALRDAEAVVLVTEWREFREMDPAGAFGIVSRPVMIDGRNALDAEAWRAAGWAYAGMGRP